MSMAHVDPYPMVQQQQHTTNTTVVVTQPTVIQAVGRREWSSGLMGCCSDPGSCFCALCCPLCYRYILTDKAGESMCLPVCLPFGWLVALRTKVREQNNIEGSIMKDCCAVTFCDLCVQCQLDRELTYTRNAPHVVTSPGSQVLPHT